MMNYLFQPTHALHDDQFGGSHFKSNIYSSPGPQKADRPAAVHDGVTKSHVQIPVAIVGMACRLPGHCNNPKDLWEFMIQGKIAANEPPKTRFNLSGHHDSSQKPHTMKSPGAMFMEDVDPADFDAQFFNINYADASSMDPQQRNLMEVSYECLENAGIPIESLDGQRVGCLVGASAVDYHDMNSRDPEDRTESPTMGSGRALLGNRISHFLNIRGPSMSIDTACSSALTALDMACLYLQANQADAMLVGGVNMYLSPERNQDMGTMRATASPSGRCHTFDSKADGYVAAEAINVVFLKRLQDAVQDGDPIRAVIRGTSVNSAGKTPGIAMPDAGAQAEAIRAAYANAGIPKIELSDTGYLECHGTGTLVGDPIEVQGVASVFANTRQIDQPLAIGSLKGNIGHSEAAAGISSLIKAVLAIENGIIPGTATFMTPNPRIDFETSRVKASRNPSKWPSHSKRRVSINSFGFGGANAHAVIESPEYLLGGSALGYKLSYLKSDEIGRNFFVDKEEDAIVSSKNPRRPKLVVLSANDGECLKASIKALSLHLLNPCVSVTLEDLAYTLSERRSQLYHRAYSVQVGTHMCRDSFVLGGQRSGQRVKVGFVFTGQGAQWPMMGRDLLDAFPKARKVVEDLDSVLATLRDPPSWTLLSALTQQLDSGMLREPEYSQPIVTALQLAYLSIMSDWGIMPESVIGHSSGEIAAAVAAGYLTAQEGIKIAFFRGQAAKQLRPTKRLGMLAIGLSAEHVREYIDNDDDIVQIACFNSPRSLTLSGTIEALERLKDRVESDNHFARILQVDLAYHSSYMDELGKPYLDMLQAHCTTCCARPRKVAMFSSVTGMELEEAIDITYWVRNMTSQVRFHQAMATMIDGKDGANFLIEIGPSNALAGPISQICESTSQLPVQPNYISVTKRGSLSLSTLYEVAGKLFAAGGSVDLRSVNEYNHDPPPSILVDLPNYVWNHSKKYWHEGLASKDWRFRPFVKHDLLGTKSLGTLWRSPSWRNKLRLDDNPWLGDHKIGDKIVFPGAGYICMAMEGMYQTIYMSVCKGDVPASYIYRLKDIKFSRALVLDDSSGSTTVMLTLAPVAGTTNGWYEFTISAMKADVWNDHSSGFIRIESGLPAIRVPRGAVLPLKYPAPTRLWYKTLRAAGFNFGPSFQKHMSMEYTEGQRTGRSIVSLDPPASKWPQSAYCLHPVCMDGCFQTVISSAWAGDRSNISTALIPSHIDSLVVPFRLQQPKEAISVARSDYIGVGREELMKNYSSSCTIYHPNDSSLILELKGLRYTELDSTNNKSLSHACARLIWDADITLISETTFRQLTDAAASSLNSGTSNQTLITAQRLINLAAHKNPNLRILEINFDPEDFSSLWLDEPGSTTPIRSAFSQYTFLSINGSSIVTVKEKYCGVRNAVFKMLDLKNVETYMNQKFDLVLAKFPLTRLEGLAQAAKVTRGCLEEDGLALILHPQYILDFMETHVSSPGFNTIWQSNSVALGRVEEPVISLPAQKVFLVHLAEDNADEIKNGLQRSCWSVIDNICTADIPIGSTIVVVDEIYAPVLSNINLRQWHMLQLLIERNYNILWVTKGAHMSVNDPTRALASGLFRVVRNEAPFLNMINLDVEHSSVEVTVQSIDICLKLLRNTDRNKIKDSEFVERSGVMHISRILPDLVLNMTKEAEIFGKPTEIMDLHASEGTIRLRAERVGDLDSLHYGEISNVPLPLEEGSIEIEVFASGVNFKDVASTIGIIPENEYLLGGEGAGLVTRISPGVTDYKKGQRVAFFKKGSFGNRVQARTQVVHAIPDSMTFEEACTIPCVFMTSMYSLFHLAQIKKGDRVLVHSAAGGVGISAIQLCLYVGAVVYATVGTQEKRDFLQSSYGIPNERIFSSRTRAFGQQIMEHTCGMGVDIILNSLAGDLLEVSWSIIAAGGTMIEIGKKDILDRNTLSMEPFNRNASFRALDLSHEQISDDMIANLLSSIFELLRNGHIKPISPAQVFSFTKIPDALRKIRSGRLVGKLVISNAQEPKTQVPVRRAHQDVNFRDDVCYLICGGLRGLCSSLAIYMARHGARFLAVMSRSGYNDEKSQKAVHDIRANGCDIELIQGDITSIDDVRKAFASRRVPVGGIIQGTMVIRDRTFQSMTADEYHAALNCKFHGTWNLHNISTEQGCVLEFFTLLSSISGVYGSPGQANYASGNTFLDAFASYRQSLGLAACSVDLGVVEDIGYMVEHDGVEARYDDTIWHKIDERLLRKIFNFSTQQQKSPINSQTVSQIITGIRTPQPEHSPLLRDARFSGLRLASRTKSLEKDLKRSKDCQAIFIAIRSKAEAQTILDMAAEVMNNYLMKSLRLSEPLDCTRPLLIYGIDSLAAIEFRNFVKSELGVELTTLDVLDAASLLSICEMIIQRLLEEVVGEIGLT